LCSLSHDVWLSWTRPGPYARIPAVVCTKCFPTYYSLCFSCPSLATLRVRCCGPVPSTPPSVTYASDFYKRRDLFSTIFSPSSYLRDLSIRHLNSPSATRTSPANPFSPHPDDLFPRSPLDAVGFPCPTSFFFCCDIKPVPLVHLFWHANLWLRILPLPPPFFPYDVCLGCVLIRRDLVLNRNFVFHVWELTFSSAPPTRDF